MLPTRIDRQVFYECGFWYCVDEYDFGFVTGIGADDIAAMDDADKQAKKILDIDDF